MDPYQQTFTTWDNLATLYQDKFMHLDLYDDTYRAFCERVSTPNARLLEIGCGPGNITRFLLTQRPDFDILATDISPNMIQLARKNNPTAQFSVMDGRAMDTLLPGFDAVICGFCMPYLSKEDSVKLFRDAAYLLHHGGILYVSTIEGDDDQSGYETSSDGQHTMYIYYHSARFLTDQLLQNSFESLEVFRKEYPKKNGAIDTHMILLARKNGHI